MGFKFYPSAKAATMFDLKQQSYSDNTSPYKLINRLLGENTYATFVPRQCVPGLRLGNKQYLLMLENGAEIAAARQKNMPIPEPKLELLGYYRVMPNKTGPAVQ